ncbi:hypothetical protein DC421_10760 [Priestia megaterium]|nr:hypothetical protein DC428_18135 [Priestia megaterium]PVE83938.1 hypothetical protein DC421_10760 [Priestia megaterium]PVE91040.1 hypothetical protein DC426_08720 [Priestia megaterium]PVF01365.1 hypothetical protein DC433_03815 [Priestia megaterium]
MCVKNVWKKIDKIFLSFFIDLRIFFSYNLSNKKMKSFSKLINVNDFDNWNLFFKKFTGCRAFLLHRESVYLKGRWKARWMHTY